MGWHGVSTKRITCWAPNQFCRFNQIRGSPVLNCWPVACDDYLAMVFGFMSHVSKIGRQTSLVRTHMHYPGPFHVFIPSNASSFTMFHPWIFPHSPTRAAKRLFPSAGSQFMSCSPVSRDPRAFRLGSTADIRTDPVQLQGQFECQLWIPGGSQAKRPWISRDGRTRQKCNITSIDRRTDCRI